MAEENVKTTVTAETTPAPKTGEVVDNTAATTVKAPKQELSTGGKVGASIAIGVGNLCCGPVCYMCPTVVSTIIGIVLYSSWKKERPETAKTILWVTIITAAMALVIFVIALIAGVASSAVDSVSNY